MTATLSAAALRMPCPASVAAPAPMAQGTQAEPCPNMKRGLEIGGITLPSRGLRGGTDSMDRFGGMRPGSAWHRQDVEQLAGGGPLRE